MSKDQFPPDAFGDVLRRMAAAGDKMSKPRDIDFVVATPSEMAAQRVADIADGWGYAARVKHSACVPSLPWDVTIVKHMVPTHEAISKFEAELELVAARVGGRNDGWGSFQQE